MDTELLSTSFLLVDQHFVTAWTQHAQSLEERAQAAEAKAAAVELQLQSEAARVSNESGALCVQKESVSDTVVGSECSSSVCCDDSASETSTAMELSSNGPSRAELLTGVDAEAFAAFVASADAAKVALAKALEPSSFTCSYSTSCDDADALDSYQPFEERAELSSEEDLWMCTSRKLMREEDLWMCGEFRGFMRRGCGC